MIGTVKIKGTLPELLLLAVFIIGAAYYIIIPMFLMSAKTGDLIALAVAIFILFGLLFQLKESLRAFSKNRQGAPGGYGRIAQYIRQRYPSRFHDGMSPAEVKLALSGVLSELRSRGLKGKSSNAFEKYIKKMDYRGLVKVDDKRT